MNLVEERQGTCPAIGRRRRRSPVTSRPRPPPRPAPGPAFWACCSPCKGSCSNGRGLAWSYSLGFLRVCCRVRAGWWLSEVASWDGDRTDMAFCCGCMFRSSRVMRSNCQCSIASQAEVNAPSPRMVHHTAATFVRVAISVVSEPNIVLSSPYPIVRDGSVPSIDIEHDNAGRLKHPGSFFVPGLFSGVSLPRFRRHLCGVNAAAQFRTRVAWLLDGSGSAGCASSVVVAAAASLDSRKVWHVRLAVDAGAH